MNSDSDSQSLSEYEKKIQEFRKNNVFLDPKTDMIFKGAFSSTETLTNFIKVLFVIDDEKFKIVNSDFTEGHHGQLIKSCVFDISCKDQDNNKFIIEMQRRKEPDLFKRLAFYGCSKFLTQLPKGKENNYNKLNKVYVIALLDFMMEDEKEPIVLEECFMHGEGSPLISYVYIQLPAINNDSSINEEVFNWLDFMKNAEKKKEMPHNLNPHQKLAYENIKVENFDDSDIGFYMESKGRLGELENEVAEKDRIIVEKDRKLVEKERRLAEMEKYIQDLLKEPRKEKENQKEIYELVAKTDGYLEFMKNNSSSNLTRREFLGIKLKLLDK